MVRGAWCVVWRRWPRRARLRRWARYPAGPNYYYLLLTTTYYLPLSTHYLQLASEAGHVILKVLEHVDVLLG